jgi:hypothetical protein
MARFAAAFFLLSAGIAGFATAALAGGSSFGTIAPVPVLSHGLGSVNLPSAVPTMGASPYQAFNNGSVANSGAVTFSGGVGSGVGMNISDSDGVTFQSNIDATRNVQAGSTVNVNETVNGQQVGYEGAAFLSVMTDAQTDAQNVLAQRQAANQELENEALMVVQAWQSQGY